MLKTQERLLQIDDLRLNVREWEIAQAPLLVLLHGLASTSHMFDLIAPSLAEHFHVIAPDQRGHGLSDKPSSGYDFEAIAGDVDWLLDLFDARSVLLVGHSWGAYTALYYAATRAKRVAKVGLIDGGLRPLSSVYPTWDIAETEMSPPTFINQTVDDIRHMIEVDWLGSAFRPELLPLALSVFDTSDPRAVRAQLSRNNHMKIARALWEMLPSDYFSKIRCPLLAVNAIAAGQTADAEIQAIVKEAEGVVPQMQVVWMKDTIHDIPWHHPRELTAILERFLLSS